MAQAILGRELNNTEMRAVADNLPGALDWIRAVEVTLKEGLAAGVIRSTVENVAPEEPADPKPHVRELPDTGWAECYDGKSGHQCNAIHVSEGIDEEGQLYVRREWASRKFGLVKMQAPGDFTPHDWGPAYVPESGDTLEDVQGHLDQLVEDGNLAAEERDRSETFYKRLFSQQ